MLHLRLHTGDFGAEHLDALLEFGQAEQLQILPHRLDEPLTAADANFRRFFHVFASLLHRPPLRRYPSARGERAQD
jgi:hypothetical protein